MDALLMQSMPEAPTKGQFQELFSAFSSDHFTIVIFRENPTQSLLELLLG